MASHKEESLDQDGILLDINNLPTIPDPNLGLKIPTLELPMQKLQELAEESWFKQQVAMWTKPIAEDDYNVYADCFWGLNYLLQTEETTKPIYISFSLYHDQSPRHDGHIMYLTAYNMTSTLSITELVCFNKLQNLMADVINMNEIRHVSITHQDIFINYTGLLKCTNSLNLEIVMHYIHLSELAHILRNCQDNAHNVHKVYISSYPIEDIDECEYIHVLTTGLSFVRFDYVRKVMTKVTVSAYSNIMQAFQRRSSNGQWKRYQIDDINVDFAFNISLANVDGHPAVAYSLNREFGGATIYYARALNEAGTAWSGNPSVVATGALTSFAVINNNPAITFITGTQYRYLRAGNKQKFVEDAEYIANWNL